MKKIYKILIFATFSLLLTSCVTVSVRSDHDKKASFTQYKTFAFHKKGIDKLKLNDLDKNRILQSIEKELSTKGMTKVNSNPDLFVNVLAASQEEINVNQMPMGWGFGGWGFGGWGFPNNTSVNRYRTGTIVIDLIDNARNILVWQGQGRGLNVSNINRKAERIPKAINEILAKYPPKS